MKKFTFTIIFTFIFCFTVFAQTQSNSNCPEIKVSGPSAVVRPGETMTFTVNVGADDLNKIEYDWSVDKGTIIEGQGTPVITVSTEGLDDTAVTATIEVKGLPDICEKSFSESGIVSSGGDPIVWDEFGKIHLNDQKLRLATIKSELDNRSESSVLIILYHTSKDNKKTLSNRSARIKNFLVKEMNIPEKRVIIVFGGEESDERTRIYIVPEGAAMPEDYDTKKNLDDVEFSSTKNKNR